jgi:hypothetical protein
MPAMPPIHMCDASIVRGAQCFIEMKFKRIQRDCNESAIAVRRGELAGPALSSATA